MKHPITVRASIQSNGVEITSDSQFVKKGITEVLLMRVRFLCQPQVTFKNKSSDMYLIFTDTNDEC